jgi:hypothetical protein
MAKTIFFHIDFKNFDKNKLSKKVPNVKCHIIYGLIFCVVEVLPVHNTPFDRLRACPNLDHGHALTLTMDTP